MGVQASAGRAARVLVRPGWRARRVMNPMPVVQLGEVGLGGELGVEDEQAGSWPVTVFQWSANAMTSGSGWLWTGRRWRTAGCRGGVFGEEGQHRAGALGAAWHVVLFSTGSSPQCMTAWKSRLSASPIGQPGREGGLVAGQERRLLACVRAGRSSWSGRWPWAARSGRRTRRRRGRRRCRRRGNAAGAGQLERQQRQHIRQGGILPWTGRRRRSPVFGCPGRSGPGSPAAARPAGSRPARAARRSPAPRPGPGSSGRAAALSLRAAPKAGQPLAAITSAIPVRFSGVPPRPARRRSRRWSARRRAVPGCGAGRRPCPVRSSARACRWRRTPGPRRGSPAPPRPAMRGCSRTGGGLGCGQPVGEIGAQRLISPVRRAVRAEEELPARPGRLLRVFR